MNFTLQLSYEFLCHKNTTKYYSFTLQIFEDQSERPRIDSTLLLVLQKYKIAQAMNLLLSDAKNHLRDLLAIHWSIGLAAHTFKIRPKNILDNDKMMQRCQTACSRARSLTFDNIYAKIYYLQHPKEKDWIVKLNNSF